MLTLGAAATLPRGALGQGRRASRWRRKLVDYLQSLAQPDGGYAWEAQGQSHLTPTFAVIGCYRILNLRPPAVEELAGFLRTHHPGQLKKLEQEHREFEFQQVQSLLWLGADVSMFNRQVDNWKTPTVYLKQYEQHGYPVFRHEITAFTCRALLGKPASGAGAEYIRYVDSRRRANGSFNNTPADDGTDGHVLNTWWGLQALETLGRASEKQAETVAWLRGCQLPNGGFTWQPQPGFAGVDDVAYTWAAVRALKLLGAAPVHEENCVQYLLALAHPKGGYSDRPGWARNPLASWHALEALESLGALDELEDHDPRAIARRRPMPSGLRVFSIQIEAHGQGSPTEAVELARALHIHLWGAKNARPEWIVRAQAFADQQKVPVRFFVANEEYGTWVNVPGLGTYSHMSDVVAPSAGQIGSSLAQEGVVSWADFRARRLEPLQRGGGRLVWQFGENEALVRLCLDDALERGGYAAISTFHFGNPDFTNSEPFLQRYRGRIPFIALQDAHGDEAWWFADMTEGFRTVFLATEPTWAGWLQALEHNRVASIRHDALSGFKTWMHGGSEEVLRFVRRHSSSWQWWDNPEIRRPLVSIVSVHPADEFETARPRQGVTVRVRCAWENTTQGRPKKPIVELVSLAVDGSEVAPKRVAPIQGRAGTYADYYHEWRMPDPALGPHRAIAVVRDLRDGQIHRRTMDWVEPSPAT